MKKTTLILILILSSLFCFGQKAHLEPAKEFENYEGILKEYYDNVFPLLYQNYSEKPIARYTSMPSFSNEYSFSIETMEDRKYVVSNKLSTNYWYSKNKKNVKLISNKAKLTENLYQKIIELFKLLDEHTKKSEDELIGFDGTTYYFATTNENEKVKIGETWSPNKKSQLGRLVSICDEIFSLGNGENISQSKIVKNIEKLITELK